MATKYVWAGTGTTTTVTSGVLADIQAAINAAVDGDTVEVGDGTYLPATPLTITGKGIRLKSQNPRGALLRGDAAAPASANAGSPDHAYVVKLNLADGSWVEDFDIRWSSVGVDIDNSDDVVIQGNLIESCFDVGISVFDASRPIVHMNEIRDPYLAGDTAGTLTAFGSVADAQMDYGAYFFGTQDAIFSHNYCFGIFNQACSFKEGNRDYYVGYNTFEGANLSALILGQNVPGNGPYEHSGLPQAYDGGTITVEFNVFRPVVEDGNVYRMNSAIRVWHVDGIVTVRQNVIEVATAGILVEGREGSEAGYATGVVDVVQNTIGGNWQDENGNLVDVMVHPIRLYKGVPAEITLGGNALAYVTNPIAYCFDDGGLGDCPSYTEFRTLRIPVPKGYSLALRAPQTTFDPDLGYSQTVLLSAGPGADVPHLTWPFRMGGRKLRQVEQDSLEDVQQSVYSYLATEKGERPLSPDFGLDDPTFGPGVNPARLSTEIEQSEDGRAAVTVTILGPDGQGVQQVDVVVELAE